MSFDQKCYDLAKLFLTDGHTAVPSETRINELAQAIQDAIEDFLSNEAEADWRPLYEGEKQAGFLQRKDNA